MAIPHFDAKDLLSRDEMELFTLSQSEQELAQRSASQLRDKLARARSMRDRARTLYRKQVGRTQAATGTKRGFTGTANERSRQKAELLSGVVETLMQRRDLVHAG